MYYYPNTCYCEITLLLWPAVVCLRVRVVDDIQTQQSRHMLASQAAGAASRERRGGGGEGEPPHAPADVPAEQQLLQGWPVRSAEAVAPSRPQTACDTIVLLCHRPLKSINSTAFPYFFIRAYR
eukprot:SAG25_NODE_37_length_19691_cov_19.319467_3_plen_124_part_00